MRLWSVGHVAMRFAVAADSAALGYRLDRAKLRQARRREGRYLLRTNLTDDDPARLWRLYLQLVSVEEAFRNLKSLPREGGATSPSGRSFARTRRASRRISSSPSSTASTSRPGARPHPAQCHRKIRRCADDRSACPDHRRLRAAADPLHRADSELALLLDKLKFVLPAQPKPKITAE
jgi:hypothetical protein